VPLIPKSFLGIELLSNPTKEGGRYVYGIAPYVDLGVISISKLGWALFLVSIIRVLSIKRPLVCSSTVRVVTKWDNSGNFMVSLTAKHNGKYYSQDGYCVPDTDLILFLYHHYLEIINKIVVDNPSLLQI